MWRQIIIHNLDNILNKIEAEHPYKVPGDSSSYNQYNEGWCDCLDRVRLELKDVNDGWISVEEGLPEKPIDGYLIVTDTNGRVWDGVSYNIPGGFYKVDYEMWHFYKLEVIAWQPLPKAYRKK